MDEETCNRLICEIAVGNMEAFEDLYISISKTVFFYSLGIVNNWHLAEDITQDVFIRIKLNSSKYKEQNKSIGWILTLTKNTACNYIKKSKHEKQTMDEEAEVMDAEDEMIIKEALEKLSRIERKILLLYLIAGVSQKDIARQLRLPVTTVNWKYRAAIKKLEKLLE